MSKEYDAYLSRHRHNVRGAYLYIKQNLPSLLKDCTDNIESLIMSHDMSKEQPDEYNAYDDFFYKPGQNKPGTQEPPEYQLAWLHHSHRNPHHWNYWVLYEPKPCKRNKNKKEHKLDPIAFEMPYDYIIEMICDWWSFSFDKGNLEEIFDWYDKNKDKMILHERTRDTVEYILLVLNGFLSLPEPKQMWR